MANRLQRNGKDKTVDQRAADRSQRGLSEGNSAASQNVKSEMILRARLLRMIVENEATRKPLTQ